MKLYDNDAYRDEFMKAVYDLLSSGSSNDRANQIIELFDAAPSVEAEPAPSNDPLTLVELREMVGEPVWIAPVKDKGKIPERWMLVADFLPESGIYLFMPDSGMTQGYKAINYGKTWLAYRRRTEV